MLATVTNAHNIHDGLHTYRHTRAHVHAHADAHIYAHIPTRDTRVRRDVGRARVRSSRPLSVSTCTRAHHSLQAAKVHWHAGITADAPQCKKKHARTHGRTHGRTPGRMHTRTHCTWCLAAIRADMCVRMCVSTMCASTM